MNSIVPTARKWVQEFSAALHEVRLLGLQADGARASAYEEAEYALECVIRVLSDVTSTESAATAYDKLKRESDRLRAQGRWTLQIDQALELLEDHVG